MMRNLNIVFMGTPEFAVPSLRILLEHGYRVVGVVTATDKPGGRGRKELLQSDVKKFALEQGLPILQPPNLKDPAFQEQLLNLGANLQVVVAFRMLPKAVWSMPEYGAFNLHGSLLPKYRGAAPINWAIIRGEKVTGVTSFFIREDIDTGNIILQRTLEIGENETAGELHDRMMLLAAHTVLETVRAIEKDEVKTYPQDDAQATLAPKIFHETCAIDVHRPTQEVYNFIRGLSPYPGAWTLFQEQTLKIFRATALWRPHSYPPGTYVTDKKTYFRISTPDGFISLTELQLEGRRRLDVKNFLNGLNFENLNAEILLNE